MKNSVIVCLVTISCIFYVTGMERKLLQSPQESAIKQEPNNNKEFLRSIVRKARMSMNTMYNPGDSRLKKLKKSRSF